MSKNNSQAEKRTESVSFRLTPTEFLPYKEILKNTDLSKTDFFRSVFLNKQYSFTVKENKPIEYKKVLFLVSKISNNINQIAHRLNADSNKGIITQNSYNIAINRLKNIEDQLRRLLDAC